MFCLCMRHGFVAARAADRYAPAAHTLTEALLPTTCVVVNKAPALKHFPTIGLRPTVRKSFTRTAKSPQRRPAPRRFSLNSSIRQSHEIRPCSLASKPQRRPPRSRLPCIHGCSAQSRPPCIHGRPTRSRLPYRELRSKQRHLGIKASPSGRFPYIEPLGKAALRISDETENPGRKQHTSPRVFPFRPCSRAIHIRTGYRPSHCSSWYYPCDRPRPPDSGPD